MTLSFEQLVELILDRNTFGCHIEGCGVCRRRAEELATAITTPKRSAR